MSDDGPRLGRAMTYINRSDEMGGFGDAFVNGAGGLVMAFFTILIGIGESLAGLIIRPADEFANVTALLIDAGFGAPARFLQDAWNTAAVALGMDPWMSLGPFVVTVAMVAVIATIAPLLWYTDMIDADTLTGIDIPIVGLEDGGDLEDEED